MVSGAAGNSGREPEVGYIPNHALLEELVRVGGGDPSRVGDAEVLESYFSGLGTGVMRRVDSPERIGLHEPGAEEFAQFRTAPSAQVGEEASGKYQAEIDRLSEEINTLYIESNTYGRRETQRPLFQMTTKGFDTFKRLFRHQVTTNYEFQVFIRGVDQSFFEARNKLSQFDHMASVERVLNSARLRDLHALRIEYAHETEVPPPDSRRNNPETSKRAAEAMRRLAGASHIEADNAEGWVKLQIAVLKEIQEFLQELRNACREVAETPRAEPAVETEFVWKE
jgi:hypothetical protein